MFEKWEFLDSVQEKEENLSKLRKEELDFIKAKCWQFNTGKSTILLKQTSPEVYSEFCQIFKMETLAKILNASLR